LAGLKAYADRRAIADLNLSYFGNTPPSMYGLATYALPPVRAAMSEQGAWWLHRFYPPDPAPGVYTISVANLMGGPWNSRVDYAFFRAQPPDAVIGHTIYVYTIAPRGAAANLSLAGLQIDQIDAVTYRRFDTNDVRPRWFEAASALIAAPGESWIALADDQSLAPEFRGFFAGVEPLARAKLTDEDRSYALYRFDLGQRLLDAAQHTRSMTDTVTFGETATLIGYEIRLPERRSSLTMKTLSPDQPPSWRRFAGKDADDPGQGRQNDLTLVTYWRAGAAVVTPLQMFAHAVGPDGAIVAQSDRLDASPFGWRPGDIVAQIQHLGLPPGIDQARLQIGFYNSDTGERLPVIVNGQTVDRRLLLTSASDQ
jgi:hypothetical protein